MTCHFTTFLTVFQSYQEDGRVSLKGNDLKDFCFQESNLGPLVHNFQPYTVLKMTYYVSYTHTSLGVSKAMREANVMVIPVWL